MAEPIVAPREGATHASAFLALTGCQSVTDRAVTPISAVVESAQTSASSELIIGQMRSAGTTYALRGSDFADLAQRGVPDPVLGAPWPDGPITRTLTQPDRTG